jgi:hypothetical protein
MTRTTINGKKYLKLKEGNKLTDIEKKKLLNKEIKMSFYGTGYFYYEILK